MNILCLTIFFQVFVCLFLLSPLSEVSPRDLVEKVLDADAKEDDKRIDVLLCGALSSLKNSRAKPDAALFIGLMYLAKTKPMLFETETVVDVSVCTVNESLV